MALRPKLPVALCTIVLPVSLAVTACRGGLPSAPPGSCRIAARLTPDGADQLSTQAVFYDERPVFTLDLGAAEELAMWTFVGFVARPEIRLGATFFRTAVKDVAMERVIAVDPARVHAIRVTQAGLAKGEQLRLGWAGPGESFTDERSVLMDQEDATGSLVSTYTFRLAGQPLWKGQVTRLRLAISAPPDRRFRLVKLAGLELAATPDRLAALVARSWRVDLNGDARTAVLAPAGHPFERELDVPKGAVLRVACGLEPAVSRPVRFRISASTGEAQPASLLDVTVAPAAEPAGCAWHEQRVDLACLSGRRARLRFETESGEPLNLFEGFPAWANLTLTVPERRVSRPNVIIIVIDTLRADHLSLYGYDRPTSPHVEAWAKRRGVVFDTVVASAPWTLPSHASLFTGLDALTHGANGNESVPEGLTMLAERLRAAGYETQAITGGGLLAPHYGLLQGFDGVVYWRPQRGGADYEANDIVDGVDHALAWLPERRERPFFLFFHTYETHSPYRPREPYFARFHGNDSVNPEPLVNVAPLPPQESDGFLVRKIFMERGVPGQKGFRPLPPERLALARDLYDSEVAFADEQVGRLLARLEELGLDRSTIVVLTSDHGESLGERGYVGHASLASWELLVPLVVAPPDGREPGRRVRTQVRLVDLAPTILELAGLEPAPDIDGRSLVPLLSRDDPTFPTEAWSYASSTNYGIALREANRLKYTFNNAAWPPIHGGEALYRLDQDPKEETDLAPSDPATQELRNRVLQRYRSRMSGLRLQFANHERVPVEWTLTGMLARPLRVKSLEHTAADLAYRGNAVCFTLAGGESLELYLEGSPAGELQVNAMLDGEPELEKVVRLELVKELKVVLSGGRWEEDPAGDLTRRTGLQVSVLARTTGAGGAPVVDSELAERLRNLGYVQ